MVKQATKVFYISLVIVGLFIIWGTIPESIFPNGNLDHVTSVIQQFLTDRFGWFYLMSATGFLVFSIYLIFSPYGKIKLGRPNDEPEFSYISWFAMLFSAGMGIGLVFWGTAEPLMHYYNPPLGEGETIESARIAMQHSFFHWGLHPWGIYATIGLALAYFKFRKNMPGVVSSVLYPLLGEKVKGPLGTTVNVIVVFATVFGVATSLGFGAIQISGGAAYVFDIEQSVFMQLIIIAIVTVLFMLSAYSGLSKGIKYLSNTNLILAFLLMIFILFLGPTQFILELFTNTIGSYINNLPSMSLRMAPFNEGNASWIDDWTIFYWAWWIAWAPFVGTFIARVSRGRTIREFVSGVLLVPTIFGALWFTIFGGSAIGLEFFEGVALHEQITTMGEEVALFALLENFPASTFTSIVGIILIAIFFITSADSATFVLGMQTTGGRMDPSNQVKFTWGIVQSATAAVLLWQGGLAALQTASIIAAFPFAIIMILMIISLVKALKTETRLKQ